jgi:hypothetical protein
MANPRSLAWYHENKHRIDREARKAYMKKWYAENKHQLKKPSKEWRAAYNAKRRKRYAEDAAFREELKEKSKMASRKRCPRAKKNTRLRETFGITIEQWDEMLESQGHKCAICGHSDQSNPKIFPLVDHCHTTGEIRGLLCSRCNHGIGLFKDDPTRLENAIKYLIDSKSGSFGVIPITSKTPSKPDSAPETSCQFAEATVTNAA